MPGVGEGAPGRRSAARGPFGRTVAARLPQDRPFSLHLPATIRAAALRGRHAPAPDARIAQPAQARRVTMAPADLREAVREGREGNLVLFAVDASGSMAARQRMRAVKGAVLSLLLDAYQRRDKVGLVTFRGTEAEVALPPTSSVEAAARRLTSLATGGRTPLAAGLARAARVLAAERLRDPRRRALLVVVTDGRATSGSDADLARAVALLSGDRAGRDGQRGGGLRGVGRASWPGRSAGGPARRDPAGYGRTRGGCGPPAQPGAGKKQGGLMPQGTPEHVPDDGLTTRQRRNRPLVIVHTGPGKGKSTAAFGLALRAWNQGWPVGVFQFVKSAKWRVGEERALRLLGETGQGGAVSWNKMGEGWSWIQRDAGDSTAEDRAEQAAEGWAQVKRDLAAQTYRMYVLDEFTYPMKWGWVDVDEVISVLAARPGQQHVVITGRDADPRLTAAANLVTEMTKVKHPMDDGQKGQKGIEW